MSDLFSSAADRDVTLRAPLAERLRPRSLDEVVGQRHLLDPGRLLRRLVEADRVPSLILWGPPGTGKTTLARLLAQHTRARFVALSAVLSGVADLRKLLVEARERRNLHRERTLLFVDEIHRWSKSQQDALLDAVERGLVTLVGATTENPSFELNAALLSRTRVFVLEPLASEDLRRLIDHALTEPVRGLGSIALEVEPDAVEVLVASARGDARQLLTTLEVAARDAELLAPSGDAPKLTSERIEEAAQYRTLLYDKSGDEHYGVVSAFIKAMRGSDPDAAVYYLVRMLEAGEDPRFLCRRIVIFASEDVGHADPRALTVAVDAHRAFELVGLPEGVLPLTQAVTYLALAPKSGSVIATYGLARKLVRERGPLPVPKKLLNPTTALQRRLGHGVGYKYPHDLGGIAPGETYLPDDLVGSSIFQPTGNGEEGPMVEAWRKRVDARSDVADDTNMGLEPDALDPTESSS